MPKLQYLMNVRPLRAPAGTRPSAGMVELYMVSFDPGQSVVTVDMRGEGPGVEDEIVLEDVVKDDAEERDIELDVA